jgi:hypothetical protein
VDGKSDAIVDGGKNKKIAWLLNNYFW